MGWILIHLVDRMGSIRVLLLKKQKQQKMQQILLRDGMGF